MDLATLDKRRYLVDVATYNFSANKKIIPRYFINNIIDVSKLIADFRINPPPGFSPGGKEINGNKNKKILEISRPLTAYSIFAKQVSLNCACIKNGFNDLQEKGFVLGLDCDILRNRMGRYFSIRWKTMCPEEKELYLSLAATSQT